MSPHEMELLQFGAYGALSGLVGSMAKSRRLELPRIITERQTDGEIVKVIDLGFLVAPILGGVLAAVIDGRPQTALAYGLAAGFAGPSVVNAIVDPILRRFGLDTNVDPLKPSPSLTPTETPNA